MANAPGKSHREGISMMQLTDMFPDEASAARWFESTRWPDGGRYCGHCGSVDTKPVTNGRPMPYWCRGCQSYFSVRTGTAIEKSRLPLRKWVFAVYLYVTNLKGVSSMKLHRDLGITQKSAWYMLHRLRKGWDAEELDKFLGPVEVDETYMGGKRKNMPKAKRKLFKGRGTAGKTAVVGAKDRETNRVDAAVVDRTDAETLQGFVADRAAPGATVMTDEALAYKGMPFDHEAVNHSVGGVRPWNGAHAGHRVLLEHAETRPQGHLPQDQPEAPPALRRRVRRASQRPGGRHHRPDDRPRSQHGRQAPDVPRSDLGQRPAVSRSGPGLDRHRIRQDLRVILNDILRDEVLLTESFIASAHSLDHGVVDFMYFGVVDHRHAAAVLMEKRWEKLDERFILSPQTLLFDYSLVHCSSSTTKVNVSPPPGF